MSQEKFPEGADSVMKVLVLVIKNTATLDFVIPLLWKISREVRGASMSVLYCSLSRRKMLRRSEFYSHFLRSCGISESCFAHEEIDTSTRDVAYLCGSSLVMVISWGVPVFAYRKLDKPLVLVLGAAFTVVFTLVGFGILVELLDCF